MIPVENQGVRLINLRRNELPAETADAVITPRCRKHGLTGRRGVLLSVRENKGYFGFCLTLTVQNTLAPIAKAFFLFRWLYTKISKY